MSGRVGKRLIEFKTKVAEMVPLKKFVVVGRRGGAFESFNQVIDLTDVKEGTMVSGQFDFTVSHAYFGPEFDYLTLNQAASLNEEMYMKNLKELRRDPRPRQGEVGIPVTCRLGRNQGNGREPVDDADSERFKERERLNYCRVKVTFLRPSSKVIWKRWNAVSLPMIEYGMADARRGTQTCTPWKVQNGLPSFMS